MAIADLHWLRPYWLLSLLPLLLFLWLLWHYRQQHSPWQKLIAPHLQQHLLGHTGQSVARWSLPVLALCWLLSAIALAGPSWQRIEQPAISVNKATVLIIDMSMSMYATDMSPNRLSQARFKALDFIEALQEGELALLAFAGEAFVVSPLTPDHNNVRLLLPNLRPDIMPSQGSNLVAALTEADRLLQQAGYQRGDIVALVDGFERHSERELFDLVSRLPHRLSIISFGSEEAAPVQLPDGSLLRDRNNQLVLPRVPVNQLRQLAQRGGGVFQQAQLSDSDIQAVLNQAERRQHNQFEQRRQSSGDDWRDKAVYFVWVLLPLALWLGKRGQLLLVCLLLLPPGVMAESSRNLFQTDNQRAMQAYQQGDYQQAYQLFDDPYWRGQAAYRAGDYPAAEHAWAALNTQKPAASQWHNLGNALARQGRFEEALAAYQAALEQQPDLNPARHNAELMQRLLDEQQEQEQQSEPDGAEDGAENGEQQESQQGDDASDSSSSPEEGSESSDPSSSDSSADSSAQPDADEQQDSSQQEQEQQEQESEHDHDQHEQNVQEQQRQVVESPWPDADPEQQQELNNLLRKVQDDPALLLRNRMHIEHQRRRQQQLPTGAREEW